MSEPAKKQSKITPESFTPKKPEIVNMMDKAQSKQLQSLPISNFNGEDGIYEMPPARFIGIRHNHLSGEEGRKQLGNFIGSVFKSETWNNIVMKLPNIINTEAADFTCEYMPETDSFSFIVGVFSPAGTPVPDGLDYREITPTLVWISQKEGGTHTGKSKEIPDEYEFNCGTPEFPWQAFLRADTYSVNPIKLKNQQSPESFTPKKPEIINLMDKAGNNVVQQTITESGLINFEIVKFGPSKFIGKSVYIGNKRGSESIFDFIWKKSEWVFKELDALKEYASDEVYNAALITWDKYDEKNELFGYYVGRFMKADTPVTKDTDMDYFDIPEGYMAKA